MGGKRTKYLVKCTPLEFGTIELTESEQSRLETLRKLIGPLSFGELVAFLDGGAVRERFADLRHRLRSFPKHRCAVVELVLHSSEAKPREEVRGDPGVETPRSFGGINIDRMLEEQAREDEDDGDHRWHRGQEE